MKDEPGHCTRSVPWSRSTIDPDLIDFLGEGKKKHASSFHPPRLPYRQRSFIRKTASGSTKHQSSVSNSNNFSTKSQCNDNDNENDHNDHNDISTNQSRSIDSSPCSMVYCCSNSEDDFIGSTTALLTEDRIRAFLHDYYADYDALRDEQNLDTWSCFTEQYYDPRFQFVRPSGNPIDVDGFVRGCASDMRIKSIQMVSIDSITILSSSNAAVVIYTCDHCFEYKGIPSEDRGVMTCVLELVQGEIKIIHEHRSSGRPIPRESRWQSESYVPDRESLDLERSKGTLKKQTNQQTKRNQHNTNIKLSHRSGTQTQVLQSMDIFS